MAKLDGGTLLDGYGYAYDRSSNRTARDNLLDNRFDELYGYDGLDRLADTQRSGTAYQSWDLDSLGNWSGFTDQGTSQTRTADAANQITGISAGVSPTYDAAGNMVSGPSADDPSVRLHYAYDAWNRLVAVRADNSGTPGSVVATYAYDAQGRRVQKTVGEDTLDYYYNEAWQVLQVDKNGQLAEQYAWDVRYIDAPVCRDRDTDADGVLDERLYYVQDANFNVTALVDTAGTVVERYVYDGYGKVTVYAGNWTLRSGGTAYGNCILYTGYFRDPESSNDYARNRFYNYWMGSWVNRDPLGYVDGLNQYQMLCSNPLLFTDASGLATHRFVTLTPAQFDAIGGFGNHFLAGGRVYMPNPVAQWRAVGLNPATTQSKWIIKNGTRVEILFDGTKVMLHTNVGGYFFDNSWSKFWHNSSGSRWYNYGDNYYDNPQDFDRHIRDLLLVEISGAVAAVVPALVAGPQCAQDVSAGSTPPQVVMSPSGRASPNKAVIGKLDDLQNLRSGENTLLKHLPHKGNPQANWQQNAGVLRREMRKGRPIRDASTDGAGNCIKDTGFLRAERALLREMGWRYDPRTQLWHPPTATE